jgi:predicted HTH transcriptional regulator
MSFKIAIFGWQIALSRASQERPKGLDSPSDGGKPLAELNLRQTKVLAFVEENPSCTTQQIATALEIHYKKAQRDLQRLAKCDAVEKLSDKRWATYRRKEAKPVI